MKLRNGPLLRLVALLAAWLIRCWMGTLRDRLGFLGPPVHPVNPRRGVRFIYAFWHDTLMLPAVMKARIDVLISQHADGELIAQVCRHLGKGAVRGSSTRGGSEAMLGLMERSRHAHLAVTPDGPRGPRRRVQLGLIFLASRTGLPIIPVGIGYARAWRLRSWDRFALPRPWSFATCVMAAPVHVPARLNREGLERYRRLVEEELLHTSAAAERWAETGVKPRPRDANVREAADLPVGQAG